MRTRRGRSRLRAKNRPKPKKGSTAPPPADTETGLPEGGLPLEGGLLPSDGTAPTGEGQQDIVAVPELAGLDAALQLAGQDAATLPEGAQLLAEGDTTPVGQDDTVEAYAIPAGSAYIKEIGADITFSKHAI